MREMPGNHATCATPSKAATRVTRVACVACVSDHKIPLTKFVCLCSRQKG